MSERVYVWDKFVRFFHWSLVALFALSYLTGDEESELHIYSGYGVLALVLARIAWGFIGSRYARFSDFVRAPATIIQHAREMAAGKPKRYLGHNPLGGIMVVALLLTLLAVTFSGLKLYAVEEGKGPLAQQSQMTLINSAMADDDDDEEHEGHHGRGEDAGEEFWEEVHETAVNLMLFLILLHVAGVVVSSRLENESLVKAMLTGYKKRD